MRSTHLTIQCRGIDRARLAVVKANLKSCGLFFLKIENVKEGNGYETERCNCF